MTTEVGVPGKNIIYLNIHHEGTSEGEKCSVNERWTNALLDNQSDYLVAISRFEVPMNKVPITKQLNKAIEIYRYHESRFTDFANAVENTRAEAERNIIPGYIRIDGPATVAEMSTYSDLTNVARDAFDEATNQKWVEVQKTEPSPSYGYGAFETHIKNTHGDFWDNGNKPNIIDTYLSNLEKITNQKIASIDMPPCHTLFEFMNTVNNKIKEVLLRGERSAMTPNTIVAYAGHGAGAHDVQPKVAVDIAGDFKDDEARNAAKRYNVFSEFGYGRADDQPVAAFRIEMASDYRFSVVLNHHFSATYYVKLHPELFKMMQFKENFKATDWNRTFLTGGRFMGERLPALNRSDATEMHRQYALTTPKHTAQIRPVRFTSYKVSGSKEKYNFQTDQGSIPVNLARTRIHVSQQFTIGIEEYCCYFSSPTSAADSFNRIKSIVFTSSLVTKSEGQSGNTYRRILTDFTVPVESQFSWNPYTMQSASISEGAAAELTFANKNPSSGRLLIMTDPSPLYELSLSVMAKCWNFDTETFSFEQIPLPQGSTFTCKLVFISKNDIYHDHEQRPDRLKG